MWVATEGSTARNISTSLRKTWWSPLRYVSGLHSKMKGFGHVATVKHTPEPPAITTHEDLHHTPQYNIPIQLSRLLTVHGMSTRSQLFIDWPPTGALPSLHPRRPNPRPPRMSCPGRPGGRHESS